MCYFSPIGSNQLLAVHSFKGSHAFGTLEKSHCAVLRKDKLRKPPVVAPLNARSHSQEFVIFTYFLLFKIKLLTCNFSSKLHLLFLLYSSQQAFIPENISISPVSEVAIPSSSISFPAASIFPTPWKISLQIPRGISWSSDAPMCSSGVLKPKVCTFSLSIPSFLGFLTNLCASALEWLLGVSKFPQSTAQAPLRLTDFEYNTPSGLSTSGHGNSPYRGLTTVTKDNSFSRASEGIISCILDQMVH